MTQQSCLQQVESKGLLTALDVGGEEPGAQLTNSCFCFLYSDLFQVQQEQGASACMAVVIGYILLFYNKVKP